MEYTPETFEVQEEMDLSLPIAMLAEGWSLAITSFCSIFTVFVTRHCICDMKRLTLQVVSCSYPNLNKLLNFSFFCITHL